MFRRKKRAKRHAKLFLRGAKRNQKPSYGVIENTFARLREAFFFTFPGK